MSLEHREEGHKVGVTWNGRFQYWYSWGMNDACGIWGVPPVCILPHSGNQDRNVDVGREVCFSSCIHSSPCYGWEIYKFYQYQFTQCTHSARFKRPTHVVRPSTICSLLFLSNYGSVSLELSRAFTKFTVSGDLTLEHHVEYPCCSGIMRTIPVLFPFDAQQSFEKCLPSFKIFNTLVNRGWLYN